MSFEWANHDVAYNLYLGQLLFEGEQLYVDRYDTNPPTIVFLSGCIDRLARGLRLSPILLFHATMFVLGGLGLWAIQAVFAQAQPVALLLVSLSYLLIVVGCGLPGETSFTYAFGQKEQMFTLVFIPYVLVRMIASRQIRLAAGLAFVVGLFSGFKPHFLVLVAAVELLTVRSGRGRANRAWASLALGIAAPLVVLLLCSRRSFVAFFTDLIRFHLAGAYAYFNQPYAGYVASSPHKWLLGYATAAVLLLLLVIRVRPEEKRTCLGFAALVALAYGLVLQQHKFWPYHSICVVSLLLMLTAYSVAILIPLLPGHGQRILLGVALAVLAVSLGAAMLEMRAMLTAWTGRRGTVPGETSLRAWPFLNGRPRVLYYSTSNWHMRLPLYLEQHVVGRWGFDFKYPSIVRQRDPARRARLLEEYCTEQRALIASAAPDAIVFFSTGQGLESAEQDVYAVLVGQCRIVPEADYAPLLTMAPEIALFLRR